MRRFDLGLESVRALNASLHALAPDTNGTEWQVLNPDGRHAIAAGVDAPVSIRIDGHAGYYCGGMNKQAEIVVAGNAGVGLAENIMSGSVCIKGDASQSAAASGRGGVVIIEGNASARCGISMKGVDIVVKGNVGPMSAFMAQAGTLVVFGDAGEALGDSLYEARLFVAGRVASLGADCIEKVMTGEDRAALRAALAKAGCGDAPMERFRFYGSARTLYHFHVDNAGRY
jgi:glutamate synthase domain-containing protein 3